MSSGTMLVMEKMSTFKSSTVASSGSSVFNRLREFGSEGFGLCENVNVNVDRAAEKRASEKTYAVAPRRRHA
jgi:hypothetical protein